MCEIIRIAAGLAGGGSQVSFTLHSLSYVGSPVGLCLQNESCKIALVTYGSMRSHSTVEILGLMRCAWFWNQAYKMQN